MSNSNASKEKPGVDQTQLKAAGLKVVRHITEQFDKGVCPYRAGGRDPSTEATAWCAVALRNNQAVAAKATKFLLDSQNKDGGWSSEPGCGKSDWCTGPALMALRAIASQHSDRKVSECIRRGLDHLADSRTEFYSPMSRMLIGAVQGPEKLKYARAWPWTPECFHWVEPTSYSLYALKIPQLPKAKDFAQIAMYANKFLLDNSCADGGWNHGSHYSLGFNLPPYIVTTCEALVALQDLPGAKEVRRALDFINRSSEASDAGQGNTALALSWLALARHCYGLDIQPSLSRLIVLQHDDGSFGPNMMVTALAALAMQTANGTNPLKFSWSNAQTNPL